MDTELLMKRKVENLFRISKIKLIFYILSFYKIKNITKIFKYMLKRIIKKFLLEGINMLEIWDIPDKDYI